MKIAFIATTVCLAFCTDYNPEKDTQIFLKNTFNPKSVWDYAQAVVTSTFEELGKITKVFTKTKRTRKQYTPNVAAMTRRQLQSASSFEYRSEESVNYFNYISRFFDNVTNTMKYFSISDITPEEITMSLNDTLPDNDTKIDCLNGGILEDVEFILYNCNDELVSKNAYEEQKNGGHCETYNYNGKACYCTSNYYGLNCENRVPILCQYEMIYPTFDQINCNRSSFDEPNEFYSNARYGIAPCIFNNGENFEVKANLYCKRHTLAIKGYKGLEQYISSSPIPTITENNDPIKITAILNLHNFVELTQYHQEVVNLEYTGTNPITVNFPSISLKNYENLRYGGRWHFEVSGGGFADITPRNGTAIIEPIQFTIDDESYSEPVNSKSSRWWVILLIVLGVLIGVALITLIVVYIFKKRRENERFLRE